MKYAEWKEEKQREFNALPIHFAFSDKQFAEVCEEVGASGADDFYSLGVGGGFYLKSDAPIIREYLSKPNELPELMKDYDFAYDAFLYEIGNHEYLINWQADYDVFGCFGNIEYGDDKDASDYANELGMEPQTYQAFLAARREHYRQAEENDWY